MGRNAERPDELLVLNNIGKGFLHDDAGHFVAKNTGQALLLWLQNDG